jgi:hypothetical protein
MSVQAALSLSFTDHCQWEFSSVRVNGSNDGHSFFVVVRDLALD